MLRYLSEKLFGEVPTGGQFFRSPHATMRYEKRDESQAYDSDGQLVSFGKQAPVHQNTAYPYDEEFVEGYLD